MEEEESDLSLSVSLSQPPQPQPQPKKTKLTDRQKNLDHSLPCAPSISPGFDLITAAKKSPWRFSSWHQFSKYSNRGYVTRLGLRWRWR